RARFSPILIGYRLPFEAVKGKPPGAAGPAKQRFSSDPFSLAKAANHLATVSSNAPGRAPGGLEGPGSSRDVAHPEPPMTRTAGKRKAAPADLPKAPTGIPGLDEVTGGGLPLGRPTLLCGGAGCGKTLLAIEFLVRGATQFG